MILINGFYRKRLLANFFLFVLFINCYSQSIQDGTKALENNQYAKAKKIFSELISSNPYEGDFYYHLGMAYFRQSKKDSAKVFFNKGLNATKGLSSVYAGLGMLMLEEGNLTQAKNFLDKALSLRSQKDFKIYMQVASAYIYTEQNKDLNKAITLLNKALVLDKKNVEIYFLLGDAYVQQFDGGGNAITSYETTVEINPNSAKGYMKIGQLYSSARNYAESLKALQKSIEIDAGYSPAYWELGELHYKAKQYEKALDSYQKYIEIADYSVESQTRYAYTLFLSKDYPNAIAIINNLIQKDSSNIILSRLIGYAYYEQNKYPEGLAFMEKFFAGSDTKKIIASDYEYYGKLLSKVGSDSMAILNLNKAITMDSSNVEPYNQIAQIYYQKKQYVEAAKAYEVKAQFFPPNSQDYFFLGKSRFSLAEYAKADSAFMKITELQPSSLIGYFWRARSNANIDTESEQGLAKPYYEKYIELALADTVKYKKELIEAYSYLGYYFFLKNDFVISKSQWLKVKELDPENKQAIEAIKNIK